MAGQTPIVLDEDDVFGVSYLAVSDFVDRADAFGAGAAIAAMSETALLGALAAASRAVDDHCGRSFDPNQTITENHKWDYNTGRVYPNQGPVVSLSSFRIRIGGNMVAEFTITPVDGSTTFGEVYYNQQENYLELVSPGATYALAFQLSGFGFGLNEPQAEIVYTSYQRIPPAVVRAVAITVAYWANSNLANQVITPGLKTIKVNGEMYERDITPLAAGNMPLELPAAAKAALSSVNPQKWG